jgi:hypothetical protein
LLTVELSPADFIEAMMKIFRIAFLTLIAACIATLANAQMPQAGWVPQSMAALRQNASSKTEFTLDHDMLIFASKLDPDDDDLRRVIAGVSGVSVHNFHYRDPWMYDSEALNAMKEEYRAAGWKQLVNKHDKEGGPGVSGVWIRFQNNAISNIAMVFARSREVSFVEVTGSISPLDLSHLGGHFGIPKIEGGVKVPNNQDR